MKGRLSHLYEMVEHEGCDVGAAPLGVGEDMGDVRLIVFYVWHHKRKPDHNLPATHTVQVLNIFKG